jgi:hypothetical protein
MRLAATLALALCVALPTPIAAAASDAVIANHKHGTHLHAAVSGSLNPAATALAPPHAIFPVAPAVKSDDKYIGLGRDPDYCNYGCIDN